MVQAAGTQGNGRAAVLWCSRLLAAAVLLLLGHETLAPLLHAHAPSGDTQISAPAADGQLLLRGRPVKQEPCTPAPTPTLRAEDAFVTLWARGDCSGPSLRLERSTDFCGLAFPKSSASQGCAYQSPGCVHGHANLSLRLPPGAHVRLWRGCVLAFKYEHATHKDIVAPVRASRSAPALLAGPNSACA